jgi:hypothetical protein
MRNAFVVRIAGFAGAFLGLAAVVSPAAAADVIRAVPPPVVVAPAFT